METLRDDLGIFLKNLRSSTIELINKDYADFVELAATLSNLEEKILAVDEPLRKIRDDVLVMSGLSEISLYKDKASFTCFLIQWPQMTKAQKLNPREPR